MITMMGEVTMHKVWLLADQHYHHSNILGFRTDSGRSQRPFQTCSEMHRVMISRHNEVVSKTDTVWHLGDFSFAKNWKEVAAIVHCLNGTHHLVAGNHDLLRIWDYLEAGFSSVHTSYELEGFNLVHDPAPAGVLKDKLWIHGHTHQLGLRLSINTYCVSVEMHDYYPVALERIKAEW